jgi:hypothetical protein
MSISPSPEEIMLLKVVDIGLGDKEMMEERSLGMIIYD